MAGERETAAAATAMTNDNCGGNGLKGVLLLQVEGRSSGAVARESWGSVSNSSSAMGGSANSKTIA